MSKPADNLFPFEKIMRDSHLCPCCGCDVNKEAFRDDISRREFEISGMCQQCQDSVFGIIGEE